MKTNSFLPYLTAAGTFLIMFVNMGITQTFGVFLPSLAEYTEHSLAATMQIATCCSTSSIFFSVLAVKALERLGPKKTMLLSLMGLGGHLICFLLITPGAATASLILMYTAGVLAAVALSFGTYAVCSSVIAGWFVEKRTQITGFVFSAAGFGAAIWVFLAGQMFKIMHFKNCYMVFLISGMAIGFFALLFLVRTPTSIGESENILTMPKQPTIEIQETSSISDISKAKAMRSPLFWLLAAALLMVSLCGTAFITYAPTWWQLHGASSTQTASWNAVYLLLSGTSLLCAGSALNRLGAVRFTILVCAAFSLTCISLLLWSKSPSSLLIASTLLFSAVSYPIYSAMPSLVAPAVFGSKIGAAIGASLMTAAYIGHAINPPIMAIFLTTEGGMAFAWKFYAVFVLVSMSFILLALLISHKKGQ